MAANEPSAATERIIRLPQGRAVPQGCTVKRWLGTETGIQFGSDSNYTADVVLVEEVEHDAK